MVPQSLASVFVRSVKDSGKHIYGDNKCTCRECLQPCYHVLVFVLKHSTVGVSICIIYTLSSWKNQNLKKLFWFLKQWNNDFWCSTVAISYYNNFYHVCIVYWNTFHRVCTGLIVGKHVSSVIPNLCRFFQNLKIVTKVLTKSEHFHML